jgi:hypothetical protein
MFEAKANIFTKKNIENLDIKPSQRTDDIEVIWKN